jgi:peptide/nickel transport system permease protein
MTAMDEMDFHRIKKTESDYRWRDLLMRLVRNRNALAGALIILVFLICAAGANLIAPHGYNEQNLERTLVRPLASSGYPLGTDEFGRCLLSRIIYGTRITFAIGFLATAMAAVIGTVIGLLAGYYGRAVDQVMSMIINITWSFPLILLALILVVILGSGASGIILSVGFLAWAGFARVVRGEVLAVREREFILAARALRLSSVRIILRHVLPNVIPAILVMFSLNIGTTILIETGLSFLGLGVRPPNPSWGMIISMGRTYIRAAPWLTTFPGVAIMLVVLGFNLLGDGLRDVLDPKLRDV